MAKQKGNRKVGRTERKAKRRFGTPKNWPMLSKQKADSIRQRMNLLGGVLQSDFTVTVKSAG